MSKLLKWHRSPLLRFVSLGLMLWLGKHYLDWRDSYRIAAPSEAVLDVSYQDWARRNGRFPTERQRTEMRDTLLSERILFAEALRYQLYLDDPLVNQRLLRNAEFLGIEGSESGKTDAALSLDLHKSDELIRQHLVQRMKAVGRTRAYPLEEVAEAQLHTRYLELRERWRLEPRLEIQHLFFSKDHPDMNARVMSAKKQLAVTPLSDEQAISLGDHFLLGNSLALMELPKLRDIFGEAFMQSLSAVVNSGQQHGEWFGLLDSAYGVHLVKIVRVEEASYRTFGDVKKLILDDYVRDAENHALHEYLIELRNKYEVIPQ